MGHSEFVEWMAFYQREPFGETRADIQMSVLAATVANVNRKKGSPSVKPSKFLPDWWEDGSRPEALLAKFRAASIKASANTKNVTNGAGARNTSRSVSRRD